MSTKRVSFLVVTADGFGGVGRAVLALAGALADRHEVEIISVYRRRDEPVFAVDPRVRIRYLIDQRRTTDGPATWVRAAHGPRRRGRQARLDRSASELFAPDVDLSRLADRALRRHLPRLPPGALITARPSLHVAAAALAPAHVLTVAQDHLPFPVRMRKPAVREAMRTVTSDFDALVTLTAADAADYRRADPAAFVTHIPNPLPWPAPDAPAALTRKVVLSAGRLKPYKGFDRLVDAYAPVAAKHPDWALHIYGKGADEAALRARIAELGIENQVVLRGFTDDLAAAMSGASMFAMASRFEAFGMALVEAMSRGLPPVSYDCPRGPGEIIEDGRNGRLLPNGDTDAFTGAVLQLIEDEPLRRRLGAAALADAERYRPAAVADRWDELFAALLDRRASRARPVAVGNR